MRSRKRNVRQTQTDTPLICPCGAQIDGRGDFCRKCRGRRRWLRRARGKRRDQWREFNRSQLFFHKAVNAA